MIAILAEFFKDLILALGPNLKAMLDKIKRQKQNEMIDSKNVEALKNDIDSNVDREKREKDTSNLINGN